MAKGDVTLKFDAQTGAFVQAIVAAREKLDAMASSARKAGNDTARAGDIATAAMKGLKDAAASAASSIGLVTSAAGAAAAGVEIILRGVNNSIEETQKRAATFRGRQQTIAESLAASGQIGQLDRVNAEVNRLANQKFGPQGVPVPLSELTQMVAGIHGLAGGRATEDQMIEALRTAAQARAGGMGVNEATNVGANVANLRAFGVGGDITSEAARGVIYAPGHGAYSEMQLKALNLFPDKDQGARLLAAGERNAEGGRVLTQMVNESFEEISQADRERLLLTAITSRKGNSAVASLPPQIMDQAQQLLQSLPAAERSRVRKQAREGGGGQLTDADARKLILSQFDPAQRLQLMLENPELLAPADRQKFASLKEAASSLATIDLTSFQKQFAGSRSAETLINQAKVTAGTEKNDDSTGAEDALQDQIWQARKNLFVARHSALRHIVPDFIQGRWLDDAEWELNARAQAAGGGGGPGFRENPRETLDVLNKIHDQIMQQNDKLDQQTSTMRTRRDTTLSHNDHQPGAQ